MVLSALVKSKAEKGGGKCCAVIGEGISKRLQLGDLDPKEVREWVQGIFGGRAFQVVGMAGAKALEQV